MSEVKVGDIVRVSCWGNRYTTYRDMFDKMVEENDCLENIDFCTVYMDLPHDSTYVVLAVKEHMSTWHDVDIALIHNNNKDAFLIGVEGLTVVE